MRKSLAVALFLFVPALAMAWPRLGDHATPVTQSSGDRAHGFSVSVTSGTAKLVYSGTSTDREVMFQNLSSTYSVHCGTFSAVTATTGVSRWVLRAGGDYTTNGTYDVYCVSESGLGNSTIEIVGNAEYDRKD